MFRMVLEFDENKVLKDSNYDIEQMYDWLDKICLDTWFDVIGKGEYELINNDVIGTLLVLVSRFKKQSWLIPNLKTWKTFDDEDGEQDALKFILEDL
jgi:hypothetical protein